MSSLQISVLLISAFIIVMVLATIFKRQQRTVLWSSAILIFTGTLILIGVGVIKLIKNNAEITGLLGIAILLQIPILFFGIGLEDGFSFYNLFVAILSFGIDYFYLTQLYNLLKE